jgi:3-oxoacyl-[acyl-carrier-protein] synthase III
VRARIVGTGSYAPPQVVTNADMERIVETSDAWIVERTGIRERRKMAPEQATSDLCIAATQQALEQAGWKAEELDLIVVGTISPDYIFPSTATVIQGKIGAKKAVGFDVSAACAGSLFALSVADRFIRTGGVQKALVLGSESLTKLTNYKDRNTCVLFGDGAGAMLLAPTDEDRGLLSTHLFTDGTQVNILLAPGGGSRNPISHEVVDANSATVAMNGREVYKFAVRALVDALKTAFQHNGVTPAQVDHIIAHQANQRIIEAVCERIDVPLSKVWMNIERYGNTSSASLPTTLDEANRAGRLKKGDLIAMMAIGGGMAWGSAMVRW